MKKKGFVLYFDAYDCITALPAAQRGELLTMLMEYARNAAEGKTDWNMVRAQHPDVTGETSVAFLFIAQSIRRDTEKWLEKQQRYKDAARQRAEEGKVHLERKGREQKPRDNSWMREYIDRRE